MERRKIEIQTNFNRLKEECGSLVNLLNSLLDRHMKSMKIIENMRPDEILKNSNYFINVSRGQYEAVEKILTVNLDLESFLLTESLPQPTINAQSYESIVAQLPSTTDDSDVAVEEATYVQQKSRNNSNTAEGTPCISLKSAYDANDWAVDKSCINQGTSGISQNVGSSTAVDNKPCIKENSRFSPNIPVINFPSSTPKAFAQPVDMLCGKDHSWFGQNIDKSINNLNAGLFAPSVHQNIAEIVEKSNAGIYKTIPDKSCTSVPSIHQNIAADNIAEKSNTEIYKSCIGQNTIPDKSYASVISQNSPNSTLTQNSQNRLRLSSPECFIQETDRDHSKPVDNDECCARRTPTNENGVESNDDTDDDRTSSESSETVTEKLKKRKCTSRLQRYLKNMKKPPMPDLSFKVVPYNSSTEFCSATDGELDVQTESDVAYQESYNHSVIKNADPLQRYDRCIVSHMVSPSEFYVNKLFGNHDQINSMVTGLERLGNYFNKFSSKEEANLNINRFCMAYSTVWESWNRAEILDWQLNATPNTAGVKVQYVDYGDYEIVPYHNLRILPHELCDKPRLAVKCHLAYLFPPDSTPVEILHEWPESSIAAAKELLGIPNTLHQILFIEKSGNSYGIDLGGGESEETKTIGQQLIDAGKAVEIFQQVPKIQNSLMKAQLRTAQGMNGVTDDMNMDQIMHQFCDNVVVTESDKLEEAITGYAARDEARICRFTKNGSCFKGANCRQDHEGLSKSGVTTDKLPIYMNAFTALQSPLVGQDLKICITSVCSVNKFYGQIRSYDFNGETMKTLSNSINSNSAKHQPLKLLPANGEIIIAKYVDNKWYRGKVCDITSNNKISDVLIKVFFVDFGDVMDVQFGDLRQISEKYLHLPFQAVRFHINNIIPKKGSNVDKAIEYFEQVYLYKIFTVNVIYVAAGFLEVLVSNCRNEDIGTHLIDVGYAESKIISLLPLENGKFLVD